MLFDYDSYWSPHRPILMLYEPGQCCRDVVAKGADEWHRGCVFESYMCHNKNAIG